VRSVASGRVSGGVLQHAGRAEWLPHGSADRRGALPDADAAGAVRHLPGAIELQAAIRIAVSLGADRGIAMDGVLHRWHRCRGDGDGVLGRLRNRELAGVLSLDADVLAGLPHRGSRAMVDVAEPVRAVPLFRRLLASRLALPFVL